MWIRAKVCNSDGIPLMDKKQHVEMVFNLCQAQSWRGYGNQVELDMGCKVYRIEVSDKRMEILTGVSGNYADHG